MALKHTRVAVTTDDPTADVKMSDWNAEHIVDTDGLKIVADTSVPSAPASGFVTVYGKVVGGGALPAFIDSNGWEATLQPLLAGNRIGLWGSIGNSSAVPQAIGINPPSTTGTATARNVATTNLFTSMVRTGYVGAAAGGVSVGGRLDKLQYWRGNGTGLGGFRIAMRFGCSDAATVANARSFVGLVSTTTVLTNADPSSNTNLIGVGTDSGDTTLSIMTNDGSGTATKVSLGANFPDHTLSVDLYELMLFAPPNASFIGWQVTRLNTGDVASGTVTTDLPVNTQLLAPQYWRNSGPTALAVGIDFVGGYFERGI